MAQERLGGPYRPTATKTQSAADYEQPTIGGISKLLTAEGTGQNTVVEAAVSDGDQPSSLTNPSSGVTTL